MMSNKWDFEPNQLFFKYNNLQCKILRRPQGHFVCYVIIEKNNIFYEIDYDNLYLSLRENKEDIKVDLSFSDYMDSGWAFGFGYTGIQDFIPGEDSLDGIDKEDAVSKSMRIFLEDQGLEFPVIIKEYRNIERAVEDVKSLADILIKYQR